MSYVESLRVRKLSSRTLDRPSRALLSCVVCASAVLVMLAVPADAAFPGRNGRIAYVDSDHGLSSVLPSGARQRELVRDYSDMPAYSPRGDRLLFTSQFRLAANDPGVVGFRLDRLELLELRGRTRSALTEGDNSSPAWAPDGRRIVFTREEPCRKYYAVEADCPPRVQRDTNYGILVRGSDGSTRVLARNGIDPVWSPDGRLISYTPIEAGGGVGVHALAPDGSNGRPIIRRRVSAHDWSPDSRRIVFSYPARARYDIAVVRRDGTGFRRLGRNGQAPAYSPDGRWIVFVRTSGLRGRYFRHCDGASGQMLWVMAANGRGARPLRYSSGNRICGSDPNWQPLPRTR